MFYGWWIVVGVFLSQMVVTGFYTYSFPLFVLPIEAEFAASRTEVMAGMSGAGLVGVVLPLIVGPLVDKWSVRGLMVIGACIFGAGFIWLSKTPTLWLFTVSFALVVASANILLGPVTGSAVVSRWFSKRRGMALGIAAMGTSIGGFVMPILIEQSIAAYGWRQTLQYIAGFVLLILLPYLLVMIRNHPADKSTTADGEPLQESGGAADLEVLGWKAIMQHSNFWLLGLSLGLFFACYSATMANITAYAIGHGVESALAARLISVVAVFGFIGKFLFGSLADRMSLKLLLLVAMVFTTVALLILAAQTEYSWMLAAALLMGLAAGGMLPVWGAILPALFGLANYGRVMGFMMPIIALLTMPGFVILASIYDATGGYRTGLLGFSGVMLLAMLLFFLIRMPTPGTAR